MRNRSRSERGDPAARARGGSRGRRAILAAALGLALVGLAAGPGRAEAPFIVCASTTSTEQSGLFGHLLPAFEAKTGIAVRVVAQGTGQAIQTGMRGDADVLFVHDRPSEDKFVAGGYATRRYDVMYNDFVVVGPKTDPAGIRSLMQTAGLTRAAPALAKIAAAQAPFASRGDDSGTHKAERRLWQWTGLDPKAGGPGGWYRETGSGMGPTLNTAAAMEAYTLADRGTWLNFKNRGNLEILVQGDPVLFNPYGVMLVNPARFPHVKAELGQRFIDWLIGPDGQKAIADYQINGEQLFFPNAKPAGN